MLRKIGWLGGTQEDAFCNGFMLGCLMFILALGVTAYQFASSIVDYCAWTLP